MLPCHFSIRTELFVTWNISFQFYQCPRRLDAETAIFSLVLSQNELFYFWAKEIGRLNEEQPRLDWEHIADMMHDYKGLLAGWPQVLHIHSVSFLF